MTLLAVGIGLVIIWVGIFILALTAAAWWAFASFERSLADGLLGTHLRPAPRPWQAANGTWPRIKAHFASLATWKDLAFLCLKFPLGLASFILAVTLGALSLALIAAPFYYGHVRSTGAGGAVTRGIDFGAWTVDRLWQALLLVPLGVLLLIVSLHVFNGLAAVWRAIARGLLESAGEPRPQATAASEAAGPSLADTQAPTWNPYSYPPPPAAQPQQPSQAWPSQQPLAQPSVGQPYPSQPPYPGQAPSPYQGQPSYASQPPYPSPPPYPGWPYASPPAYPSRPAYPPPAYPAQPAYPPQPPQPEQPVYPAQPPAAEPTAAAGPPSDRPRPAPPAPSVFPAPPWGEWPSLYGPPAEPGAAPSESPPAEPASHDNPPAEEERP